MESKGQIYELIGKAIGKVGAIGKEKQAKDSNGRISYKFRGIDDVYNALNPVLAELGIFFCPEVLDQKREERTTKSGTVLTYTLLTVKYTAYAPDGSSVSMTVVGEGMDAGDKGSNKAMSVAMKYAMFQIFCIPTEEMKDPDADVYDDILPKNAPARPAQAQNGAKNVTVTTGATVPQPAPAKGQNGPQNAPVSAPPAPAQPETAGAYLKRRIAEMKATYPGFDFQAARKSLIESGTVPDVPSATMKMEQAVQLMEAVRDIYEGMKEAG